ncbi:MAG TPA: hypothetical protein VH349_12135 [Ktedonobacterales bacterium]|jgi:hypothetical protein
MRRLSSALLRRLCLGLIALLLASCGEQPIRTAPLDVTYAVTDLGVAPPHISGDLIVPDAYIRRINSYGQIVGELNQATFFWTPTTPNGTTGARIDLASALQTPCFDISALNDFGQVAGVAHPSVSSNCDSSQGEARVFLWTPSAPNGAKGTVTYIEQGFGVWALNAWGQVLLNAHLHSLLWTPSTEHGTVGETTPILPVGEDDSDEAIGLNLYGQVIAQSYIKDRYSHAYLWTPAAAHGATGALTILRSDGGEVIALNDFGQVLGMTSQGASDYLWTPGSPNGTSGEMRYLPALSGDISADFHGLSAEGLAYGISFSFGLFSERRHAVGWLPTGQNETRGKVVPLGAVGSDDDSMVSDMNAAGQVVGQSCTLTQGGNPVTCKTQAHAFIWDSTHGLHDLQGALDDQVQFRLEDTQIISDQGQIAAIGEDTSQMPHLLLLTPHR